MNLKITKYVHSCLLVESEDRVALFDPGVMSVKALNIDLIATLDDIFITHIHQDHISTDLVQELVVKFPSVRITSTPEVVKQLASMNIEAQSEPPEGVTFFNAPHENVSPLYPQPENIGIHYLDVFSDPGDSHSFNETKAVLALPITAPWGGSIQAMNLVLKLKPAHVIPIHDWHWSDEARKQTYNQFEQTLAEKGITFHKMVTGQSVDISL